MGMKKMNQSDPYIIIMDKVVIEKFQAMVPGAQIVAECDGDEVAIFGCGVTGDGSLRRVEIPERAGEPCKIWLLTDGSAPPAGHIVRAGDGWWVTWDDDEEIEVLWLYV